MMHNMKYCKTYMNNEDLQDIKHQGIKRIKIF